MRTNLWLLRAVLVREFKRSAGGFGVRRREPFGHMAEVLPLADAITTLYARCAFCEGVAHFTGEAARRLGTIPRKLRSQWL